jgi:hypothetical protein
VVDEVVGYKVGGGTDEKEKEFGEAEGKTKNKS